MRQPVVSIIICTRDRTSSLVQTMRSIGRCEVPDWARVELLIVDNSLRCSSAEAVRTTQMERMALCYVHEPKPGKANACNTALAKAQGEILLFTDDDVRVPENWIGGMTRKLRGNEADAVQGGIRVAAHLRRRWLLEGFPSIGASTEGQYTEHPDFLIGANMALSRCVLEKVPRFDPDLGPGAIGFAEESLFATQLLEAGYRIGAEFDVAVEHHFDEQRLDSGAVEEACRKMGRSKAYLAYHWDHSDLRYFDWSGCVRKTLAYTWRRICRPEEWGSDRPPRYWRMPVVEALAFVGQYLQERSGPRRYTRRGLTRVA